MNGHDNGRETSDKGTFDCVTSMEVGAFEVGCLDDLIMLHWDDTIMHAASRTEIIHGFSPRCIGSKTTF